MIRAVLFDVIGTTVKEKDPTVIMRCFENALRLHGVAWNETLMRAHRGLDKKEMIQKLLVVEGQPPELANAIYEEFGRQVQAHLSLFEAQPGLPALFHELKQRGVRIGLGTGLSRDLLERILHHLQWPVTRFDYVGVPGPGMRGRPHPDMIEHMMQTLGLTNQKEFLKIGDTVADIEEGKNAGVVTAVVLAGTQPREQLEAALPDYVLPQLNKLLDLKLF